MVDKAKACLNKWVKRAREIFDQEVKQVNAR